MSMISLKTPVYKDGRTKQSFKDSTDINKIVAKAQVAGGLAHALKYPAPVYGEFTGVDLLSAFEQISRARVIFNDLPAEVRSEFDQDAFKFAGFASDPANIDRLQELIPALAKPGEYVFVKAGDEPAAAPVAPVVPALGDEPKAGVLPAVPAVVPPAAAPDASSGT